MDSITGKINFEGTFNCINSINLIFPILYIFSLFIILSYDFYNHTAFLQSVFIFGFLAQLIFYFVLRKVKSKLDEQPNKVTILSFSVYLTGIFYYINFLFFMEYIKQFNEMHDGLIEVLGMGFKEFFEATLPNDARLIYIYILVSLISLFALPLLYLLIVFIMAFVSFLAIIIPSLNLLNMFFIMYLSGIYYLKYGLELYRQIKYEPIPECEENTRL